MNNMDVLNKPLLACLFLLALLLQGCATSHYDATENAIKVNQDMADAWRRHGDESMAQSFEARNAKIREDEFNDYSTADLLIDIVTGGE